MNLNNVHVMFHRLINGILKHTNPVKWATRIGVNVGDNTMIASNVFISTEPYLISIGSNCQITNGVSIHTHGGANIVRRTVPNFDCFGKVVIKDWVYIGSNSIILPGVTIGEESIIAAGSVVTKSVAPRSVVGGNPARFICTIDDYINRNLGYNTMTKGLSEAQKKEVLLSLPDEKFISK